MLVYQALAIADEAELDLVMITATSDPPVVKVSTMATSFPRSSLVFRSSFELVA